MCSLPGFHRPKIILKSWNHFFYTMRSLGVKPYTELCRVQRNPVTHLVMALSGEAEQTSMLIPTVRKQLDMLINKFCMQMLKCIWVWWWSITHWKSLSFYRILFSPGYFQKMQWGHTYHLPNRIPSQIGL